MIDDKLMRDTLRATRLKTKREAVDLGLRTLLRITNQAEIRKYRGKLSWRRDLDAMRIDSQPTHPAKSPKASAPKSGSSPAIP